MPLPGAIVVCYGWGGGWTWCHCTVPSYGAIVYYGWGRVTTNFGGADVVPLLGAIARCHCSLLWSGAGVTTVPLRGAHGTLHSNGIQKKHPEKTALNFCRCYIVLYIDNTKLVFAIWGLRWYNFFHILISV